MHRDVKSSNFLVFNSETSGCPRVKIGDFGLAVAKMESRSEDRLPNSGNTTVDGPRSA